MRNRKNKKATSIRAAVKRRLGTIGFTSIANESSERVASREPRRLTCILATGNGFISIEVDWPHLHELVEMQGWRCFYCGETLHPELYTRDHFFPRSLSRRNRSLHGNSVISCARCNHEEKGNRLPSREEFARFSSLLNVRVIDPSPDPNAAPAGSSARQSSPRSSERSPLSSTMRLYESKD